MRSKNISMQKQNEKYKVDGSASNGGRAHCALICTAKNIVYSLDVSFDGGMCLSCAVAVVRDMPQ